jgi:hypothetical protein
MTPAVIDPPGFRAVISAPWVRLAFHRLPLSDPKLHRAILLHPERFFAIVVADMEVV